MKRVPLRRKTPLARGDSQLRRTVVRQPRVNARCETCGAKFSRTASQVRHRGPARFCSRECQVEGFKTRERRPCERCGTEFVVQRDDSKRGKFCSRECYDYARRATKETVVCPVCGEAFETWPAWSRNRRGKHCSRECAAQARRLDTGHSRGVGWKRVASETRQRFAFQCVRCGGKDGRELSVDHIIPWRRWANKTLANHPFNLRPLCVRCHGIKTAAVEPRLERGDWLALESFYGRSVARVAMALFFEGEEAAAALATSVGLLVSRYG